MDETDDAVTITLEDGVAILRINRPNASNAVTPAVMAKLCDVLDKVIDDRGSKAIVLSHSGEHFIAGADFGFLEELKSTPTVDVRDEIYRWFQGAAKRLHLCPKPTVAAIGGAAITVGCELAIACDFRIVTEKALFQESWIKLGLVAPLGGAKLLPQMVGWSMAKDMILRSRPVRGREAVDIGLATELVDETIRESRAIELARELAAVPPLAYRAAKEGLWHSLQTGFEESWAATLLAQSILIGSEDFREAHDAIIGNRKPVFKGR